MAAATSFDGQTVAAVDWCSFGQSDVLALLWTVDVRRIFIDLVKQTLLVNVEAWVVVLVYDAVSRAADG